jgi:hypothetical protein
MVVQLHIWKFPDYNIVQESIYNDQGFQLIMPQLWQLVTGFLSWWPRFDPRSSHVEFVVGKMALGQFFSEYFSLLCQSSFHQILHIYIPSGTGTIDKLMTDVPSGLNLIPPPKKFCFSESLYAMLG